MQRTTSHRRRMVRFAAVSAAAGLLDYAATALMLYFGVPDFIAFALGIALAGGLSFIGHELWTFETAGSGQPHGRLLRWALTVAVTLVPRILIWRFAKTLLSEDELAQLVALALAFLLSSGVQYLASRYLVFTRKS